MYVDSFPSTRVYDREVCCLHIVERADTNFGLTYWLQGVLETLWPAERFP